MYIIYFLFFCIISFPPYAKMWWPQIIIYSISECNSDQLESMGGKECYLSLVWDQSVCLGERSWLCTMFVCVVGDKSRTGICMWTLTAYIFIFCLLVLLLEEVHRNTQRVIYTDLPCLVRDTSPQAHITGPNKKSCDNTFQRLMGGSLRQGEEIKSS